MKAKYIIYRILWSFILLSVPSIAESNQLSSESSSKHEPEAAVPKNHRGNNHNLNNIKNTPPGTISLNRKNIAHGTENSKLCIHSYPHKYNCGLRSSYTSLTPTESKHLEAFNFVRSYLPDLQNGNYDNIKDKFISKIISKSSQKLTNETSKFLESIPFVLNASLDLNIGLDSDFTYGLSAVYNLSSSTYKDYPELKKSIVFGQTKFFGTTSSGSTWNIGLGGRKIISDDAMAGLNTFWDYRITPYDVSHSRFGIGGELFWKNFELRNNWYIAGTGPQDVTINSQEYVERVVPGWDVELGYRFENLPELAVYARTFRWDYQYGSDNSGLELSTNYQATPYINIEAYTSNEIPSYPGNSNDNLTYDQWVYGFRVNFSLSPKYYKPTTHYKERFQTLMEQPVRRRYDVLLERKKKSSSGVFSVSISGR